MEPAIVYMHEQDFDPNTTSILILNHAKTNKLLKWTEVYQYTFLDFIGDSGGTVGIFVGLSLYSIYLELMEQFYKKMKAALTFCLDI